MLEYDFNELDNDFVTLWSKKIVSGEDTLIFRDLTKLAELGQINAVQSWYLLAKDNDDNAVIDNIVDNLGNGGANELLAIAHKDFLKNDRLRQISNWYCLKSMGVWGRDGTKYEREYDDLCDEIEFSAYGSYLKNATEMYYHNYENTHNLLSLERFYEMMGGRAKVHKSLINVDVHASSREFRKLRKTLLEMYERDKNNVAVAFALGKNLTLFKANGKLKALGNQILTDLSKRELSKTLQDYEVKGTERLIKQQIDKNAQAEVEENLSAQDRYELEFWQRVEEAKSKHGIKFLGNHNMSVMTPEELGIIEQDSKRADEMKYGK